MKRFAVKIKDGWIEMIPAEFMQQRNMSIPPVQYEASGLLEMSVDPDPADSPDLIIEDGEIQERNGRPHVTRTGREPSDAELKTIKRKKREEINAAYSEGMRKITRAYPAEEREGWAEQVAEVERIRGGKPTPLLDKISELTRETPQQIADKVSAKREQYLTTYARATAARQIMTARVDDAAGKGGFESIDPEAVFLNFAAGGRGEGLL